MRQISTKPKSRTFLGNTTKPKLSEFCELAKPTQTRKNATLGDAAKPTALCCGGRRAFTSLALQENLLLSAVADWGAVFGSAADPRGSLERALKNNPSQTGVAPLFCAPGTHKRVPHRGVPELSARLPRRPGAKPEVVGKSNPPLGRRPGQLGPASTWPPSTGLLLPTACFRPPASHRLLLTAQLLADCYLPLATFWSPPHCPPATGVLLACHWPFYY